MKILVAGNIGSGKSTLCKKLLEAHPSLDYVAVDDFRRRFGDGTMEMESMARKQFLVSMESPNQMVVEFMGRGDLAIEVRERITDGPTLLIILHVQLNECLFRLQSRTWDVPYPGTIQTALELCKIADTDFSAGSVFETFSHIPSCTIQQFNNQDSSETQVIIEFVTNWIKNHETT